jgi:4'-phosphopantetheinyl transferase
LSHGERERASSIRHPVARNQFLRGRLMVRSILATLLNEAPHQLPIQPNADGKPKLDPALAPVHFNVSHTTGLLAVAVGWCELGIDVEAARHPDPAALVARYFSHEEQFQFFQLPNEMRPSAFLRGWTCKEALLKGTGTGVRDLQHCAVDLDPRCAPRVLRCPDSRSWQLHAWEFDSGISAALAVADIPD